MNIQELENALTMLCQIQVSGTSVDLLCAAKQAIAQADKKMNLTNVIHDMTPAQAAELYDKMKEAGNG